MSYRPLADVNKRKEVRQLLEDWAPWHYAGGAAAELNLESRGGYGPAAAWFAGSEFEKKHRPRYRHYFDALAKALTILRHMDRDAYAVLYRCYLSDPGDPDLPRRMTKKARPAYRYEANRRAPVPTQAAKNARDFMDVHTRGIDLLAGYLVNVDTSGVVFGVAGRKSQLADDIAERHDTFYDLQTRFVADGMERGKAIETAADQTGLNRSRGYAIMNVRERPVSTELID